MWIVFSSVIGVLFLVLSAYADPEKGDYVIKGSAKCSDEGIWLADSLVDCKFLGIQSDWGINTDAETRCKSTAKDACCLTCTRLGFTSGSPDVNQPSVVIIGDAAPPPDTAPPIKTSPTQAPPAKCSDEGIWLGDMLVDCKHLEIKSDWGLHVDAEARCKGDARDKCCLTCHRLGFTSGGPDAPQPPVTKVTATPPVTKAPTTASLAQTQTPPGPVDPSCTDRHVWLMDMGVDCQFLEKSSIYGLHTDKKYYCTVYPLTECCRTCAKLGFPRSSNQSQTTKAPTTTTSTTTPSTTTRKVVTAKPARPACRDIGIWSTFGLLSCKNLERKSIYKIHENPLQYCRNPWTTWCCETCARLQGTNS